MVNALGYYKPEFYANEGLIFLENALTMGGKLYRGFDAERRAFDKGDIINIKRPSSFVVNDAPSTAQDLAPDSMQMTLNLWKEVKFKLTDKDFAVGDKGIIDQHIRPAAYALADYIDSLSCELFLDTPHVTAATTPAAVADITAIRGAMFDRKVPMRDLGFMVNGTIEAELLNLSAFTQWQGAGSAGAESQRSGMLGKKYGFDFFANQNVKTPTADTATYTTVAVNGAHAKDSKTLAIDATALSGTIRRGTILTIGGLKYAVTADVVAAGNAATVSISPPVRVAIADNAVVTVTAQTAVPTMGAFSPDFAAIAFGRLSDELPRKMGALVSSVQDPKTGFALRSRMYYVGNSSEIHVALDVLFGLKVMNGDLAHRLTD